VDLEDLPPGVVAATCDRRADASLGCHGRVLCHRRQVFANTNFAAESRRWRKSSRASILG
jgi:hypothetical protein